MKRIPLPEAYSIDDPSSDAAPKPALPSTALGSPPLRFLLLMGGAGLLVLVLLSITYRAFFHEPEPAAAVAVSDDTKALANDARPRGEFDVARDEPAWGR